MANSKHIVLGVTGASGAIYGVRLLQVVRNAGCRISLSISASAATVLRQELNLELDLAADRFDLSKLLGYAPPQAWDPAGRWPRAGASPAAELPGEVVYFHFGDFLAPIASGSAQSDAMVICPCSGGTASAIAHATSENLICRAADVHLKERRKLVLVPRETPLSGPQLENLLRCAQGGAVVLPAMPGFYHGPQSVLDLVDFVVARVCDQLGVPHNLAKRWGES